MFSKEMENLIQATLEDGKLEENEKAALIKRAKKEGIDLDELEIYINSLLQKRQRELNKENEAQEEKHLKAKKEAFGQVCPNCGKQVPPLTLKCDCGYEFTKGKTVSSAQLLFEKLNNIQLTEEEIDSCSHVIEEKVDGEYRTVRNRFGNVEKKVDEDKVKKLKEKKKQEIISSFPVPNTKEDIVEFLALAAPNAQKKGGFWWGTRVGRLLIVSLIVVVLTIIVWICTSGLKGYGIYVFGTFFFGCFMGFTSVLEIDTETLNHNVRAEVWKSKFDQVMIKARSMRGDPEFTQQLDYYEYMVNSQN